MTVERVYEFVEATPTPENYLRSIVLFGRNVASYKFALAKSLLEVGGAGVEVLSLEDLAVPFSRHLCEHLKEAPKQATSPSSSFLDACRRFNEGSIDENQLRSTTVSLGFNNVIDAFHVVGPGEIPMRFFFDERKGSTKGIRLTEELLTLAAENSHQGLAEVEARWRLVETAWALGINDSLIEYESSTGLLVPSGVRRTNLASARDTLNGYQKGRCFYCYRSIGTTNESSVKADVDHLFPFTLMAKGLTGDLDQIWNLVLACIDCNRGVGGKFDATPATIYVERLARRNDYLIESNLPIKETLILQTGASSQKRQSFLQSKLDLALASQPGRWWTEPVEDPTF